MSNFALTIDILAVFGNNGKRNFVLSTKWKQIEHVQFVSTTDERVKFPSTLLPKPVPFCKTKTATMSKHCLDIVAVFVFQASNIRLLSKGRNFTINSFDIVAFFATKSNVASTLLLVLTGLKGRCDSLSSILTEVVNNHWWWLGLLLCCEVQHLAIFFIQWPIWYGILNVLFWTPVFTDRVHGHLSTIPENMGRLDGLWTRLVCTA